MPSRNLAAVLPSAPHRPKDSHASPKSAVVAVAAASKLLQVKQGKKGEELARAKTLYAMYECVLRCPVAESAERLALLDEAKAAFDALLRVENSEAIEACERGRRAVMLAEEHSDASRLHAELVKGVVLIEQMLFARCEAKGRRVVAISENDGFCTLLSKGLKLHMCRVANEEERARETVSLAEAEERKLLQRQIQVEDTTYDNTFAVRRSVRDESLGPAYMLNAIYRRSSRQRSNSKAAELQHKVMALAEQSAELAKLRGRTWDEERVHAREEEDVIKADISLLEFKISTEKKPKVAALLQTELETKQLELERIRAKLTRYKQLEQREVERQRRCSKMLDSDTVDPAVMRGEKNLLVRQLERRVDNIKEAEQVLIDENMRRMLANHELPPETKAAISTANSKNPSRQSSATRRPSGGGWGAPEEEHHGGPSPRPPQPRKDSAASMRHRVSVDGGQHSRSSSASRRQSWLPEPSSGGSPSARRASRSYEPEDEAETSRPSEDQQPKRSGFIPVGEEDAGKRALAEARARRRASLQNQHQKQPPPEHQQADEGGAAPCRDDDEAPPPLARQDDGRTGARAGAPPSISKPAAIQPRTRLLADPRSPGYEEMKSPTMHGVSPQRSGGIGETSFSTAPPLTSNRSRQQQAILSCT
jgi:hypothetical protein